MSAVPQVSQTPLLAAVMPVQLSQKIRRPWLDVISQMAASRGWTTQGFADWLADTLERTLLPDAAKRSRGE
jgi:hypothetical protein